jgi:Lon protease-like protein
MQAGNRSYDGPSDLPAVIPVFPLSGALLLPRGNMPLNIFEPRYLAMIDAALAGDRIIGMIQPRGDAEAEPLPLMSVGCAGRITAFGETGDGRYRITLTGIARFRALVEVPSQRPFRQFNISADAFASDFVDQAGEGEVDRSALLDTFRRYLKANQLEADWDGVEKATTEALVNALSMMSPFGPAEKQALLEAPDLRARAETLIALTELSLRAGGDGPSTLQ